MGTTLDFYTTPIEEESGVLCAYQYFHTLYVIEWYYDYIGYDYYDEDFNFYYYDDIGISGSGSGEYKMLHFGYHDFCSGSGDYYYDYSGSGDYYYDYSGSGDYFYDYSGSGSGRVWIKIDNILGIISRFWNG